MNTYKELKGIRQIIFAVGHIGPGMLNQFITTWLLIFLAPNTGDIIMKGSLVGVCLMLGRIVDAVADPLVANWSDSFKKSKFGRRLPFIVMGALPMVIAFNMLWYTGSLPDNAVLRFIWVAVSVNLFYFAYTVVVNPYFALLPEIAKDKGQRMFIQSFVAFFGILGMGIAMGASGTLIDKLGYQLSGFVMSVICLLTLVGPVLTVRVTAYHETKEEKQKSNIITNVKSALLNKTFRTYMIGFATFFLGFQLIQYNLIFITTVLLGLERGMSSILFIASVVSALAFIPVYNILVKKLTAAGGLKVSILSYVVVCLLITLTPVIKTTGINPVYLGFGFMLLLGFPYSGLMVIPNVIISEIIDEDVRVTGKHREALFFGVQGLINKFMVSIAAFSVGVLLDLFGNSVDKPLGVIIVGPLAVVMAAIGFVMITKLKISR